MNHTVLGLINSVSERQRDPHNLEEIHILVPNILAG